MHIIFFHVATLYIFHFIILTLNFPTDAMYISDGQDLEANGLWALKGLSKSLLEYKDQPMCA